MQRIATTVLGVVGAPDAERRRELVAALGQGANVRAVLPDPEGAPIDRAVEAWREAARAHVPFVVHDADPLAEVGSAWVDRWDGAGDVGRLEVAVQAVLQRWRAGTVELPDYHLVVAPDDLSPTERHWYLGVLASEAPHRVVVVDDDHDALARAVRRLRAGRWWPDLATLLAGLDRRVPDAFEIRAEERSLIV